MSEYKIAPTELEEIAAAIHNPKAFEPLYKRHFPAIYSYIRKATGQSDLSADLTSDVFCSALLNLKQFKTTTFGIRPWLFKIALNQLRMHFRKSSKAMHIPISEEHLKSLVFNDQKVESNDLKRLLAAHLSQLSEEEQEVIQLRFVAECTFKELGVILNISEDAAKMRMSRLLEKLRHQFPQSLKP
jgi:RNA polymerase sigma-70 factor (ECF subfamily)